MKLSTAISAMMIGFTLITAASCKKDDDNSTPTDSNIVTKNGIAINGTQEVPEKTTSAYGTANVSYNKTSKLLSFTLNWYSLSGAPTGSHIHGPADKGTNAGVKFDFFDAPPKDVTGTYSGSTTVDGTAIIEDSLLAGKYYFNIHTAANPGGEIRGQIEF